MSLVQCVSELSDHKLPRCQTFRTHTNPVSSENLKEAANFFSTSHPAPLLHTPSAPFDFSSLKNVLPVVNHQRLQSPMTFPDMAQQTIPPNLSGVAWASDFMDFQQTQPSSSSKQAMSTPPSVMALNVRQQPLQNHGS